MKLCEKSRRLGYIECLYKEKELKEIDAKDYIKLINSLKVGACDFILDNIKKKFPHLFRDKRLETPHYTLEQLKKLLSENKSFILLKHLKKDFRKWYWTENLCEVRVYEHDYNKDTQVTMVWHKYRTLGNFGLDTFLKQLNEGYWLLSESYE